MKSHGTFLALCAELDGDIVQLERVASRNRKAWLRIREGADDAIDWGALGFTIHTLYGVLESYFLRISKFFENGLPAEGWHKALVEKMSLDIPGLRPPLLRSEEEKRMVLELLKFRHRIGNLYGEDLDPVKTEEIQKITANLIELFPTLHAEFRGKLLGIAGAIG